MPKNMRLIGLHGFLGQGCDFDLIRAHLQSHIPQLKFYAPDLFSAYGEDYLPSSFSAWPELFEKKLMSSAGFDLRPDASSKRILMGYSLGGRLALDFFLQSPEAFDALVLLAPNPGLISDNEKQKRIQSDLAWSERISEDNWSQFLADWNAQEIFKVPGRETSEPVRFLGDYSVNKLKQALTHLSLGHMRIPGELLHKLQDRIYWLSGEADPKIHPLYQTLKSEGLIRHWRPVSKSGHRLLFDNPEAVAQHLAEITDRIADLA